jgi:hypothetical protein
MLAIAKHVLGDEIDRRMALKRGGGRSAAELDETWMAACDGRSVDRAYEDGVFRSKVEAAIRMAEKESDFTDFSIYRMRVFDGKPGKEVAEALGISEPTVSRRLAKVRSLLRIKLVEVITTYSFTKEEQDEAARNGLDLNPNAESDKANDGPFDEAVAEIYHRQLELRREDEAGILD